MEHPPFVPPARFGSRWRTTLAMLLGCIGVLLLIGCLYLPVPEHGADWSKRDFRPLLAAGEDLRVFREAGG